MTRTVLGGGAVLDPGVGEVRTADVALDEGVVAEVGSDLVGDERVDVAGLTLAPGLIDCHAHMAFADSETLAAELPPSQRLLRSVPHLAKTLQLGVTTVRDAWGADAGMRDAIDEGAVPGPRLLISLAQLCGTGGIGDHFSLAAGTDTSYLGSPWLPRGVFDGPAEARAAVRRMVRSGADVIKVAMSGSVTRPDAEHLHIAQDEISEIVAEASRHDVHVMAHAHGARAAESAARAGVRSIEHGFFLDEEAVTAMLDNDTWLVPTLLAAHEEDSTDEPPPWLTRARESSARSFAMALDAGVPIAMGTDCPVAPHERRLGELAVMHRLGMDAVGVWRTCTSDAARMLNRPDLGLLEPGRRADIVAVEGDPWSFDDLGSRIRHVWKDGAHI
ncbi:MAG TPA: amidohydrolase family protein [Nocardioides sp.]|nr:amidohydrolase family protein [Nocardioides sp.]